CRFTSAACSRCRLGRCSSHRSGRDRLKSMRVWDLPAGYLNRQSLLGEHREVDGIYSILTNGKAGYSQHPETLRWANALSGLALRHRQLAAEMDLRGYVERTPLRAAASRATA